MILTHNDTFFVSQRYLFCLRGVVCRFKFADVPGAILGSLRLSFWVMVCFLVAAFWVDGIREGKIILSFDQIIFQQVKFRFGLVRL